MSLFVVVQREKMRRMIEGYRFCRPIPWFTLSLESPEKLNLCYNYIKEKISQYWRICVTCKLEKQPLGGPCCTGNGFYHTLGKCLGKQPLQKVIVVMLQMQVSLHTKWSFQLRISSVNATKSAVSCDNFIFSALFT